ncbi:MAG: hypothetical protein WCI05_02905 [Myxococcales bacterium]
MIWRPWRRIRQLEAQVWLHMREADEMQTQLTEARRMRDTAVHQCGLAYDRFDKIRATNVQLRDALELYRDDHRRH